MSKYYPIFLKIQDKKCVVVGGGNIAWRKVNSLKDAKAKVTVVSPEFCPELEKEPEIELIRQKYDEKYLEGACLVVASTDNEDVNKQVYYDAVKRGLLVNVVDRPEFCTFIVPASVTRGDFTISISTGGASPALARNIRERLEKQFGNEYEEFTSLLSEMRQKVLSEIKDESARRAILQRIADTDMLEMIRKNGFQETKREMLEIISKTFLQ